MHNCSKHPSAAWLASYSAGSLPLAQSLCLATHLEHCRDCRQSLKRLQSLGGEMIENIQPASASTALKDKVMAMLDQQPSGETESAAKPQDTLSSIPRCLRKFIPNHYDELNWSRLSPSIKTAELCRDERGLKVELLRIKPGGSAATHTHLGDELTVILEGSFSDENGVYRAGDFLACDAHCQHTPVASQDRECICLVVSEAPIQFTGFISRWLNPLLRRSYT